MNRPRPCPKRAVGTPGSGCSASISPSCSLRFSIYSISHVVVARFPSRALCLDFVTLAPDPATASPSVSPIDCPSGGGFSGFRPPVVWAAHVVGHAVSLFFVFKGKRCSECRRREEGRGRSGQWPWPPVVVHGGQERLPLLLPFYFLRKHCIFFLNVAGCCNTLAGRYRWQGWEGLVGPLTHKLPC